MMAVDFHNRDSVLRPPLQSAQETNNIKPMNKSWSSCFSSSDFGSVFSSPVESEQGSNQSESDQDDDYIGELTRQMAHYMLQEDDNRQEKEAWSANSPLQSTDWPKLGSSKHEQVAMDGDFDNLDINEEKLGYHNIRKPSSPNLVFHSRQAIIDQQIRAIQLMKQQQGSVYGAKKASGYKQQHAGQVPGGKGRVCNGQKGSSANLQPPRRTGSEMTAVFLSEPGSRTGSSGTGVFLPRGITNACDSPRNTGCSTVLIPARVVQALKHQLDKMGIESRFKGTTFPIQNDALMEKMKNGQLKMQKNKSQSQTVPAMNHQEIGLPQEWTY